MVEVSPIESSRVIIVNALILDFSFHEARLLIIDERLVETSIKRCALSANNLVVVTLQSERRSG